MLDLFRSTGSFAPAPVTHKLFFALRPEIAAASTIASFARRLCRDQRLSAEPLAPVRLHVTLQPLIACETIPPRLLRQAGEAAASVSVRPFRVAFDRVSNFGRDAIVLLGHDGTPGLMRLHEQLVQALAAAGLDPGRNARFNPHVTLAYSVTKVAEHVIDPIAWTVNDFVLIDSHVGETRHELAGRWRLTG
jgi:2'-5' RNA ligase